MGASPSSPPILPPPTSTAVSSVAALRLTPTMRSRKLQALDVIKRYFATWGGSPSLSEVAAELGVSRQRVNQLIHRLERDGLIAHTRGVPRSLRLVPIGTNDALSRTQLPGLPRLDHKPAGDRVGDNRGGQDRDDRDVED